MYNSILQLAAQLTEKNCERAESGEIRDLDVMTEEVLKDCKEVSAQIIQVIIRSFNEEIRNDKETRKELGLVIKEKDRPRQLLTHLGTICFERDYFYDRNAEEYVTPLDRLQVLKAYRKMRYNPFIRNLFVEEEKTHETKNATYHCVPADARYDSQRYVCLRRDVRFAGRCTGWTRSNRTSTGSVG